MIGGGRVLSWDGKFCICLWGSKSQIIVIAFTAIRRQHYIYIINLLLVITILVIITIVKVLFKHPYFILKKH